MDCKKIKEILDLYIENELPVEVNNQVADHLDKCKICQEEYQLQLKIFEQFKIVKPPDNFTNEIMSRLLKNEKISSPGKIKTKRVKKYFYYTLLPLTAGIILFIVLYPRYSNKAPLPAPDEKIEFAVQPAETINVVDTYTVAEVKKETHIKNIDKLKFKPIILEENEIVKTAPNSPVVVAYSKQSMMYCEEKTEIEVKELDKNAQGEIKRCKIAMIKGKIITNIPKILPNGYFKVLTPNVVAGVRGTEFSVEIDEKSKDETVMVLSGFVDVTLKNNNNKIEQINSTEKIYIKNSSKEYFIESLTKADIQEFLKINFDEFKKSAITTSTPTTAEPVKTSATSIKTTTAPVQKNIAPVRITFPKATIVILKDRTIDVKFDIAVDNSTGQNGALNPNNYELLRDNIFVENAASVTEKEPGIKFNVKFNTMASVTSTKGIRIFVKGVKAK